MIGPDTPRSVMVSRIVARIGQLSWFPDRSRLFLDLPDSALAGRSGVLALVFARGPSFCHSDVYSGARSPLTGDS